jgi:solute carrier family 39 (zinc transporter), member 9
VRRDNIVRMEGLFTLLSLSTVMAAASFLAGILPLSLKLSAGQVRLISTVGMGVLVGTSLVVIIPEGVETLYSASEVGHTQPHIRRHLNPRDVDVRWLSTDATLPVHEMTVRTPADDTNPFTVPGPVIPANLDAPPKTPTEPGVVGILDADASVPAPDEEDEVHKEAHHAWIGIALLAGFMLMYLIDKVPQYSKPTRQRTRTHHIALNNLGRRFNFTTSLDQDEEAESFMDSAQGSQIQQRSFATTIGLVIHAAADGIALGASSTATTSNLSLIIFFAIMIHKAPAAFGLTSVLVKQGLSKRAARGHLILFSLAAPAGAILTWFIAQFLGGGRSHSAQATAWWTGILLLFSAGTFLYVAVHSMQEASNSHHRGANGHANGYIEGRESGSSEAKPAWKDLAAACFGMILPLFLQAGHAH